GVEHGYNDRSIDMRISTLRKKLQDNSSPHRYILTIRNKGYMMIDE
ncbi:DNA-binding response regulator, partial [Vibrio parahaemolyticus]